ncbi:MAG: hypothetical protein A3G25_08650 [Betaproteobacteria bacterium RIFCSPLOWO2_12_FULL_63_13]|nr:MAG: hypothetical protein A3G25_08650 [Betaproteobacteria bacterium RIFCSPLOWO2_12_FULL_63_13]
MVAGSDEPAVAPQFLRGRSELHGAYSSLRSCAIRNGTQFMKDQGCDDRISRPARAVLEIARA